MRKFVTPHLAGRLQPASFFFTSKPHTTAHEAPLQPAKSSRRVAHRKTCRSSIHEAMTTSFRTRCRQKLTARRFVAPVLAPFAREPTGFIASGGCLTAPMNDSDTAPIPIDPRWAAGQSLRSRRQRCQFAVRHSCAIAGRLPKLQEIECRGFLTRSGRTASQHGSCTGNACCQAGNLSATVSSRFHDIAVTTSSKIVGTSIICARQSSTALPSIRCFRENAIGLVYDNPTPTASSRCSGVL